jgi:hypothetical protein
MLAPVRFDNLLSQAKSKGSPPTVFRLFLWQPEQRAEGPTKQQNHRNSCNPLTVSAIFGARHGLPKSVFRKPASSKERDRVNRLLTSCVDGVSRKCVTNFGPLNVQINLRFGFVADRESLLRNFLALL